MRLEWLEDVLAVADTGSFQEAADRRGLTQSAFSRRIQHIEEQVGVELFDRTRKPIHLLPTTADQREQMAKLASDLRQLVFDLRRGERMASDRISIASQHSLTTSLAPLIVQAIHARQQTIHIRLRSANLDECFALLLSRQVDIAVLYRLPGAEHPIAQSFVETVVIGSDRLIPVVASSARDDLTAQLASGELPYISFPLEVFFGRVQESSILTAVRGNTRLIPKAETALTLAAMEMAAVGVGVAWVPISLARNRIADGSLADLSYQLPSCQLEVTTVRLFGNAWPIADTVWSAILASGG